jgi:uncharacterized peroxidase-related enzyme
MTIHHLTLAPLTIENATGTSRDLLAQTQAKMGFIPNMYRSMALHPGLFATYLSGYQQLRSDSSLSPVEQEVVFLVISRSNRCTYCMAAHSFVADAMSKVPPAVTNAIRDGSTIPDPRLAALASFTSLMVETRGRPDASDVAAFRAAGYEERHILSIILAIAVKTISNYINHIADPALDLPFAERAWNG